MSGNRHMIDGGATRAPISAVILAAGMGTRMQGILPVPKPLAPIGDEPLLQRNLRQLHELGIGHLTIVVGHREEDVRSCATALFPKTNFVRNGRFRDDRNILSALLGLTQVPEGHGALLLEGDVAFSDRAVATLLRGIDPEASLWSSCGPFRPSQRGGILRSEACRLREIRYSEWRPELSGWYKNLGAIYVAPNQVETFAGLLRRYSEKTLDQYFMTPWSENLDLLPARTLDLCDGAYSFNTEAEYDHAMRKLVHADGELRIELVDVEKLVHIEDYDDERVAWLADKIRRDGFWTMPVAISRECLVMDGQHRLEAARRLGLSKIPAVVFDYGDIPLYSLRPEFELDAATVVANASRSRVYPYKTVKHVLPAMPPCGISLEELRRHA